MKDAPHSQLSQLSGSQCAAVLRRASYARALGVDVWAARKKLAGVSSHLVVDHVAQRVKHATHNEANSGLSADEPRSLARADGLGASDKAPRRSRAHQELVRSLAEPDALAVPKGSAGSTQRVNRAVSPDVPPHNAATDSFKAFDLFAKVAGSLLLVDDMTHMRAANSAYANWLASMLQAVGVPGAIHLKTSDRLRWPEAMGGAEVFQNQPAAQQRQQAQDLASSWLLQKMQKARSEAPVSTLLLMGDVSARLLDDSYLRSLSDANRYWQQLQIVRVPSSAQLWADPAAKQQFWYSIASLDLSVR